MREGEHRRKEEQTNCETRNQRKGFLTASHRINNS